MAWRGLAALGVGLGVALATMAAAAQEAANAAVAAVRPAAGLTVPALQPGWSFTLTPYAWAPGQRYRESSPTYPHWPGVKANGGNPLGDLNTFPVALTAEASLNRLTLLGDVVYAGTRAAISTNGYGGSGQAGGQVAPTTTAAAALALFRVYDAPRMALEVGGGGRFWHISTKTSEDYQYLWWIGPNYPPYLDQGTWTTKAAVHWLEPVLAARYRLAISPRAGVSLYGDVGSFGLNGRLTWQAIASFDYAVTEAAIARIGWRNLSARQDTIYGWGYTLRTTTGLNGPFIAASFRF